MSISKNSNHGSYQEESSVEEYSESEVEEPPKKAMKTQKNKNDDSDADEQIGSKEKTLKKKPAG